MLKTSRPPFAPPVAPEIEPLQIATSAGKVGLWDWNIVTNEVKWTNSVYTIHGVDPATFEVTLENFIALIHSDDVVRVQRRGARAGTDPAGAGKGRHLRTGVPHPPARWQNRLGLHQRHRPARGRQTRAHDRRDARRHGQPPRRRRPRPSRRHRRIVGRRDPQQGPQRHHHDLEPRRGTPVRLHGARGRRPGGDDPHSPSSARTRNPASSTASAAAKASTTTNGAPAEGRHAGGRLADRFAVARCQRPRGGGVENRP